ncbi:MAG TPA: hypothetical protein P5132_09705, partial [Bacteroidales bacterium]|nr:hypothetical protein [Bacteroidales bacterium]
MKKNTLIVIILSVLIISCKKDEIKDWFQDPPVSPVTRTIKTVVPVGYAASLVMSDIKGYKHSNVKSVNSKSSKILYVDTNTDYPY